VVKFAFRQTTSAGLLAGLLMASFAPLAAQPTRPGASAGYGQGQRQTRDDTARYATPLERVDSRVASRVQSRIRNRIDQYYDPQANAVSPFEVAGAQARTAGRRPRR
jgi:hypothetical protein